MRARKYTLPVNALTQDLIKEEIDFLKTTIDFHHKTIKDLERRLWEIRQKCVHKYDEEDVLNKNTQCLKCGMSRLEPYQYVPVSRDEYIKAATKAKKLYLETKDILRLETLKQVLEDRHLEDSSYPTIDQI